jgi:hypothetical protein
MDQLQSSELQPLMEPRGGSCVTINAPTLPGDAGRRRCPATRLTAKTSCG